jgi:hypothetical protein
MAEKFHERFNIPVAFEEARRRFVNRAQNVLLSWNAVWLAGHRRIGKTLFWDDTCRTVATWIGEPARTETDAFEIFTRRWDFNETLRVLEALNFSLPGHQIDSKILALLGMSEMDLGIRWEKDHFLPSGATELDEALVNDSLKWMKIRPELKTVLDPFSKALEHLLRSTANPAFLSDVITDAFEALEALAKIVTGKEKTLDSNGELFLSKVKASEAYNPILREYCTYAHNFRHGAAAPKDKPVIDYAEAESFVYLTGLLIRLAISAGFAAS